MWRMDDCFVYLWLCLLLLDVSIACVSYSFQSVSFFSYICWPCHYGFLIFPCLREISSSSQMISGTVIWLLGLDRINIFFILFYNLRYKSYTTEEKSVPFTATQNQHYH